jgi:hypothetical protein
MPPVLATADHAEVADERNRLASNLPRQSAISSPGPLGNSAASDPEDPASHRVLDWQAFLSLHFPGRRRHDFEALTAYGEYRSSRPAGEQS